MVDATLLAIDEINRAGGVMGGRPLVAVVVDDESDPSVAARKAERLISEDGVEVIFGCWTSMCRKRLKPIVEKNDRLLVYSVQYEGFEESPNIFYTGAVPNQQIIPAVRWFLDHAGKRVYLVGSDYVFPRTANFIIRNLVEVQGGEIVAERYLPFGETNVSAIIADILRTKPGVIFNTINGDGNLAFFNALKEHGIGAGQIPVVSFSIAEEELRMLRGAGLEGHYAVWNYFQSIDRPENRAFLEAFRKKYGKDRVTDDPMVCAYLGVKIWANALEEGGSTAPAVLRRALEKQSYNGPGGVVSVDWRNLHLWKEVQIGRIDRDYTFDIVWRSDGPVRPLVYPYFPGKKLWEKFRMSQESE